jgi:hypothetical protein
MDETERQQPGGEKPLPSATGTSIKEVPRPSECSTSVSSPACDNRCALKLEVLLCSRRYCTTKMYLLVGTLSHVYQARRRNSESEPCRSSLRSCDVNCVVRILPGRPSVCKAHWLRRSCCAEKLRMSWGVTSVTISGFLDSRIAATPIATNENLLF